jgi:hypothetical protein
LRSRWLSFGPPVPGGCGTAHVGPPSLGSNQTCRSHQPANTASNVKALSMSALSSLPIKDGDAYFDGPSFLAIAPANRSPS